jgi:hypothetical protein
MSTAQSKRLVIDASVATSSGERGRRGEMCQSFLRVMIDETAHRLVMTREIGAEWDIHSHPFARHWRTSMNAKRRVDRPSMDHDQILRQKIVRANPAEKSLAAMEKDLHLIEAAKATDNRIISLDDTARRLFSSVSGSIGELGQILWINPTNENETPIQWLKEGSPNEEPRMIRSFS